MNTFSPVQTIKRGQVWMVKEDVDVTNARISAGAKLHVKTRPWVVITSEEYCDNRFVQAYPITSTLGVIGLETDDIIFRNHENIQNRLLLDELSTIETKNFLSYMYTMPEDMMKYIEEVTMKRLNLTESIVKLEEKIADLENQLSSIKTSALDIVKNVSDETSTDKMNSASVKESSKKEVKKSKSKPSVDTKKSSRPSILDVDLCQSWINDYYDFGKEYVMNKYGMDRSQVSSRKYHIEKRKHITYNK